MIVIKDGVDVKNLHPVMWDMIYRIKPFFDTAKIDLVITSGTDSKHGNGSLHYVGLAVDIRTKTMKNKKKMFKSIKAVLPSGYDVVPESTHLHIEYQPKTRFEMLYG